MPSGVEVGSLVYILLRFVDISGEAPGVLIGMEKPISACISARFRTSVDAKGISPPSGCCKSSNRVRLR